MLGGLLGAFLATLLAGAFARRRRWWRTFLIGMAGGALAGMALALVGILSKQFNVMPQVLNGFGGALLLAAGGALLGGVAGGLAGQQRGETSGATLASRARLPSWLVAAPALFLGLLGGLAVGLTYQYVGANIIPIPGSNPQTGMVGLLVGGATGLLGGIGIAALWNRAGKPELDRQAASTGARLGTGIALILLGVVVLTLPYWFTPLLGLNIA
jgi:hypothetical protein